MLRLQQACGSTAILSSLLDAPTAITYTVHKLSSKRRKRWRRRWRGTWEARGSIVIRCDAPSTLFVCVCGCRSKQPKTKKKGQSTFSYLILFSSGTRLIAAEQYTVAHLLDADGRKAVTLSSNWRTDESVITKEKKIRRSLWAAESFFLIHPLGCPNLFFHIFCCLGYFCLFYLSSLFQAFCFFLPRYWQQKLPFLFIFRSTHRTARHNAIGNANDWNDGTGAGAVNKKRKKVRKQEWKETDTIPHHSTLLYSTQLS